MNEKPFIYLQRGKHIATLHAEGKAQREIARLLGISQPVVRRWLIRLGLVPRSRCDSTRPSARLQAQVQTQISTGYQENDTSRKVEFLTSAETCLNQEISNAAPPVDTVVKGGIEQPEKPISEVIHTLQNMGWQMALRRGVTLSEVQAWGRQLLELAARMG